MSAPLLTVDGISKTYVRNGRTTHALKNISLSIRRGETLGLAGPSGCGKSTLSRIIMRLTKADEGTITFGGEDWLALSGSALRRKRHHMQMVFQDTLGAFNPRATVETAIGEPLRIHDIVPAANRQREILRLLDRVGLPETYATRSVLDLSGGQRQRVAIARSLSTQPSLLVMDEAVSALDVSVRGRILELLVEIQRESGIACLFVSHDIAVIRAVCHRVAIMNAGEMVESGETQRVVSSPQSETARELIAAVPILNLHKDNVDAKP